MKIILGSSSSSRRAAFAGAGYQFETMSPDIDEKAIRAEDPYDLPLLIAREKARVLRQRVEEPATVIAGDQVVVCEGHLREKPTSEDEARAFLRSYAAGAPAETVSAVVVFSVATGAQAEGVDRARVFFKPIPEEVIERYVASGDPFSQAGGFAVEGMLAPYVDRVEGSVDSVQGLPMALVESLVAEVAA